MDGLCRLPRMFFGVVHVFDARPRRMPGTGTGGAGVDGVLEGASVAVFVAAVVVNGEGGNVAVVAVFVIAVLDAVVLFVLFRTFAA